MEQIKRVPVVFPSESKFSARAICPPNKSRVDFTRGRPKPVPFSPLVPADVVFAKPSNKLGILFEKKMFL